MWLLPSSWVGVIGLLPSGCGLLGCGPDVMTRPVTSSGPPPHKSSFTTVATDSRMAMVISSLNRNEWPSAMTLVSCLSAHSGFGFRQKKPRPSKQNPPMPVLQASLDESLICSMKPGSCMRSMRGRSSHICDRISGESC